ncbi:MAG: RNA-binding cell elongation regulator Jag/EloR [Armatimonadota bacterium]|nr:RNA-binding cell elongation regulator Jag/EloR [Armatimonadota bacterium]MDR5702024.1 RNA-binding cell elongation regulator Jag/EloR [Armatimonadota bacterium]
MKELEETGRTVDEAVEKALRTLGVDRDEVDVEVLEEGSRGVFGFGGKEARVLVRVRQDYAKLAGEIVGRIIKEMGFQGKIQVKRSRESIEVSVEGRDLGVLIGKRGQTLDALEYLTTLILSRRAGKRLQVTVDVEGYRERRRKALAVLARRVARRVVQEGREIPLEPMSARDRRVIHMTLQDHPRVYTYSEGAGEQRRVVIAPKPHNKEMTSPHQGEGGGM